MSEPDDFICDGCGLPVEIPDRFTVIHRMNGKSFVKVEFFHKERCCPYAFFGKIPAGLINDIWTKPPT